MIKILLCGTRRKDRQEIIFIAVKQVQVGGAGVSIVTVLVLVRVDPASVQQHHEVVVPQTSLAAEFHYQTNIFNYLCNTLHYLYKLVLVHCTVAVYIEIPEYHGSLLPGVHLRTTVCLAAAMHCRQKLTKRNSMQCNSLPFKYSCDKSFGFPLKLKLVKCPGNFFCH